MTINIRKHTPEGILEVNVSNLLESNKSRIDIKGILNNKTVSKEKIVEFLPFMEHVIYLDGSDSETGMPLAISKYEDWGIIRSKADNNEISFLKQMGLDLRIQPEEINIILNEADFHSFSATSWKRYIEEALKPQWKEELDYAIFKVKEYQKYNIPKSPSFNAG